VALLSPLNEEQRATFLVVSLPSKDLVKIVGRLGTAAKGTRIDRMSLWDLAWSLVDHYETDAEVSGVVDRALSRELGEPPLGAALAAEGAAKGISDLLLRSRDPARELAWALLSRGGDGTGELAAELVSTIIEDYDEADEAARQEEEERKRQEEAGEQAPSAEAMALLQAAAEREQLERESARVRTDHERAKKRADLLKERVVELEGAVAAARRDLRASEKARTEIEAERDRLTEERTELRAQVKSGTPAEVARLAEELEATRRRERALVGEVAELRDAEAELSSRVRSLETDLSARPSSGDAPSEGAGARELPSTWNVPIFTDEFYDSIRAWDRKIVRIAFEKIYRLAEDWRHPSLRAIPLEGLPGFFRIRIASDVRLMYRPVEGGRIEILSLIDREDLQRYIRQAKTR
jgi:hypothetical protein